MTDSRVDRAVNDPPAPPIKPESLGPAPVGIVVESLTEVIGEAVGDAIGAVANDRAAGRRQLVKTVTCERFQRALQASLSERILGLVDPASRPAYRGLRRDGNPIVFFYDHFRLRVQLGGYYQSDLQRDDPSLFNGLRNTLKGKNWHESIAEADHAIAGRGQAPSILGVRLKDISELSDILPARRGISPRRPLGMPARFPAAVPAE